jgi:hypothetical protein
MSTPHRFRRFAITAAQYVGIIVLTLVVVDLITIGLGVFPPPQYNTGDAEVGWLPGQASGKIMQDRCTEQWLKTEIHYTRNEDGVRTAVSGQRLRQDSSLFTVGVTGDSHTELCTPNDSAHFGVMERELKAGGINAVVFANGSGKYSPLQAYLAVRRSVRDYNADAIVLNFYTGNDFGDLFRIDDRPHFVADGAGYRIAPPVWYEKDAPGKPPRSRVLYLMRTIGKKTGIRNVLLRVRYLRAFAAEQNEGLPTVFRYMNDLRKSVAPGLGYPAGFSAQMLNQQLFFHHFAGTREESVRRTRALLELIKRENPSRLLVLSALPSYELVQQQPIDSALLQTLKRLPVTYEGGLREEGALYDSLRVLADQTGWTFVDNLKPLREYTGRERLYNGFDYHPLPTASALMGKAQAAAILGALRKR